MIFRVFFVDMSGGRVEEERRTERRAEGVGGRTVLTNPNPIPKLRSNEVKADVDSLPSSSISSLKPSILNL